MSASTSTAENNNSNNKLSAEILQQIFGRLSGDDYSNRNLLKQVYKSWYNAAIYHYHGDYAKGVKFKYSKKQTYSSLLRYL
jgi:hypothetical protein